MTAVLRLVGESVEENRKSAPDNKLPDADERDLERLANGCKEILDELQILLDKYKSLGTHSKKAIHRARFALEEVELLRSRLMSQTTMLTAFQTGLQR